MTKHRKTRRSDFQLARSGVVSVLLALAMSVLIGAFAISVSQRAASERARTRHQRVIAILDSSVDTVAESGLAPNTTIRLPVDPASDQWVLVESVAAPDEQPYFLATLFRRGQVVLSTRRDGVAVPEIPET